MEEWQLVNHNWRRHKSTEKETKNTESVGDSSSSTSEESEQNGNGKEIKYSVNNVPVLLINKENIDWEGLLKEAEQMYSSWSTIVIDLNSINARNEDILSFGSNLDNLIINLKQQNKLESAISLANMYSLLPEYINKVEGNSQNYYMTKIKAGVLKAYATIEDEEWDIVSEGLTESNNNMDSLLNSELMLNNSKQNTIEEIYVLLKELTKTANQKEKDLFILKYVNLMETIEKI